MRSYTHTATIHGVPLDVTFAYYPACRGSRDRYGVPLEPDEPESIEIEQIHWQGKDVTELISELGYFEDIETEILEAAHD